MLGFGNKKFTDSRKEKLIKSQSKKFEQLKKDREELKSNLAEFFSQENKVKTYIVGDAGTKMGGSEYVVPALNNKQSFTLAEKTLLKIENSAMSDEPYGKDFCYLNNDAKTCRLYFSDKSENELGDKGTVSAVSEIFAVEPLSKIISKYVKNTKSYAKTDKIAGRKTLVNLTSFPQMAKQAGLNR